MNDEENSLPPTRFLCRKGTPEQNLKMQKNILVMGCGRSGTSMLAGLFAKSGYFMGDNLHPGRVSNPKGFFEDPEINTINEYILFGAAMARVKIGKIELFKSRPLPNHRWLAQIKLNPLLISNPDIEDRIKKIVDRAPYCLKDPRFSYTLPVWRPFLSNHVFLCIFREPEATARSMVKEVRDVRREQGYLNYINYRQALSVWTCMYTHIVKVHRRDGDWLFVHYNQVLNGEVFNKIETFTCTSIDRSFPDPLLRRSKVFRPTWNPIPRRLYATLCTLAGYEGA